MPKLTTRSSSHGRSNSKLRSKSTSPASSRSKSSSVKSASIKSSKGYKMKDSIASNNQFNIIEILLLDHTYLRDCIEVLTNEEEDTKLKLKYAKGFLDALEKHSLGERIALYTPLQEVEDLRPRILESLIEHGITDNKVKKLSKKLSRAKRIDEDMAAELKVLADIVEHHLEEEEVELFPKMRKEIDEEILNQMGYQFMVLRQFTEKDLKDVPELFEEMDMISQEAIPVKNFMNITHEYFTTQY